MIGVLARIPFFWGMRFLGFPRILPINLTVSVTFKCNSRCRTCNVFLKDGKEMSAEEFIKTFMSIGGAPYWVTLSGGEPFLRKDLEDIIEGLITHTSPSIVSIPTNGLCGGIADRIYDITERHPETRFVVNFSLDGLFEKHDEIRGVKGNFRRLIASYDAVREINFENLSVGVHTVVSKFNVDDIPEIFQYVANKLKPDSYITEIAEERVELENIGQDITPTNRDYSKVVKYLTSHQNIYNTQKIGKITQAFRGEYYRLAEKIIREGRQIIPCYAGWASGQIMADGSVWPCCVRGDNLGNLRDHNFDFKKIWFGEKADELRSSIKEGECACPLANASYTNILLNPKKMLKVGWRLAHGK